MPNSENNLKSNLSIQLCQKIIYSEEESQSKRQGILELNSVKECLQELQEKYVFVPADKAANIIIVVCKRYCLKVIYEKLGL